MTLSQTMQDIIHQAAINATITGMIIGITGITVYAFLASYRGKV